MKYFVKILIILISFLFLTNTISCNFIRSKKKNEYKYTISIPTKDSSVTIFQFKANNEDSTEFSFVVGGSFSVGLKSICLLDNYCFCLDEGNRNIKRVNLENGEILISNSLPNSSKTTLVDIFSYWSKVYVSTNKEIFILDTSLSYLNRIDLPLLDPGYSVFLGCFNDSIYLASFNSDTILLIRNQSIIGRKFMDLSLKKYLKFNKKNEDYIESFARGKYFELVKRDSQQFFIINGIKFSTIADYNIAAEKAGLWTTFDLDFSKEWLVYFDFDRTNLMYKLYAYHFKNN